MSSLRAMMPSSSMSSLYRGRSTVSWSAQSANGCVAAAAIVSPRRPAVSITMRRSSTSSRPAAATSGHGFVAISSTAWKSSGFTCPSNSAGTSAMSCSIAWARAQFSGSRIISASSIPIVNAGPLNSCSSKGPSLYSAPAEESKKRTDEPMEVTTATEQKSLLATLSPGKRTRLHRLLFEFGPGEGTLLFLPIDQGIEHGPRDFFPNPDSKDPEYQFRLAAEAGYSAIACGYGMASKYYPAYAGQVPLLLKLNSKTDVPPSEEAFSPCNASVEDAVRLGADAVGYTLYVGSPRQERDLAQLRQGRQDCDRFGMPLVVWSYPRGSAVKSKGGQDSF